MYADVSAFGECGIVFPFAGRMLTLPFFGECGIVFQCAGCMLTFLLSVLSFSN